MPQMVPLHLGIGINQHRMSVLPVESLLTEAKMISLKPPETRSRAS
jgi:hypothetical protein